MCQPGPAFAASVVLFAAMSVSYYRQKKWMLFPSALLYALAAASATLLTWGDVSPPAAAVVVLLTLALPASALFLFLLDYTFALFCLEMRYLVLLWWILSPLALPLNLIGWMLRNTLQAT